MDAHVVQDLDQPTDPRFVTEFDAIPGFWNYLVGLRPNDLIAELIQNDLDQGATRTVVSFQRTCLVCEGNGRPVDAEGWQRLRKIQGAGDEAPAKRSSFGVKNHGLKTAFQIGDEIRLLSDGQAIIQTLYANGTDRSPHPGASEHPMEDHQAPTTGCRVIVRYRDDDLEPNQGEAIKLRALGAEAIEALFRTACVSAPEQFAGIVSPEITPRYEIVLRHWRLGEARFFYSCTRPRKLVKRIEIFQRRCTVSGTVSPLPEALREQAVRRLAMLKGFSKERVADYFRRGQRFFVEASWPIDTKGKPKTATGKYRYPIGYPLNSHEACTGHGAYFNAPFVSDKERHAPAQHEATFAGLHEECESLLIDAVVSWAIPRWRADGLNPVVPSTDDGDEVVRPILAKLANKRALPVVSWRQAAELAVKGKRGQQAQLRKAIRRPGYARNARRYGFVIPALTWAKDAVHSSLSLLCPRSEMQLDPSAPRDIIRMLADGQTPGFMEEFITFDENDVFDRIANDGNQYFDGIADIEREFSEPFITQVYLDLIKLGLDKGKLDTKTEDNLVAALLLPDVHGQAVALANLYSSASLPFDIPGLHLPPILDSDLVGHALFRRNKWKLRKFTVTEFLGGGTLQAADERTRRLFWEWLCRNRRHIAPRDRTKLAELIIWPDEDGKLCKISSLCEPRTARVGTVLAGFIQRPHVRVRRSKLTSVGGTARTSIRRTPTEEELTTWLDTRLAQFEVGDRPDATKISELRRFEGELATLLKDRSIAPLLRAAAAVIPTLARDGHVRLRTELVVPSPGNDRLALPGQFLLSERGRLGPIDKLSPALKAPTPEMLLSAFAEDAGNIGALLPRLTQIIGDSEPRSHELRELAAMAIIPVGDSRRAPSELAFAGNKGDYWGDWKIRIPTEGLSQVDQSSYRAAGVTSATPNPETSRSFFEWLATRDQEVVGRHLPCVLRHILHPHGPALWARDFRDVPFIPAKSREGPRLVSLQMAERKPVFLSDAGDIGNAIMQRDAAVLLVIHQVKEVSAPISEPLSKLGVRSLRGVLREPESVAGAGEVFPVGEDVRARFDKLRSSRFRRTFRKRLNALGVESGLEYHDWQYRLGRIQEIRFADKVEARYKFRNRLYRLEADAGFDLGTGIYWMKQGLDTRRLYEFVARQLVFKPTARPIDLFALERALELEIADPSFGRPVGSEADATGDDTLAEDSGVPGRDGDKKNGLGEAGGGHSPFTPDPRRNRPKPGPISNEAQGRSRSPRRQPGSPGSVGSDGPRYTPDLEKKHKHPCFVSSHDSLVRRCSRRFCTEAPQVIHRLVVFMPCVAVRSRPRAGPRAGGRWRG